MKPSPATTKFLWQLLTLILAIGWIYAPALHGDWLWDDNIDITENTITQSPGGLWSIWFAPGSQLDYYPVKASVQWLQWQMWGMNTLGYHLTNIVLHLLSALLVWQLFRKLGLRLAWIGALLFAVHPVMVESVAWIAELKNTLSLPFFLLAMLGWLDFAETGRRRTYLAALGWFLVAMLTKSTMVMFPVVLLLFAWWKKGRIGWVDLKATAPFFLISLVLGLLTLWVGAWFRASHHTGEDVVPLGGFLSDMARAGLSLSFYFWKSLWPTGLLPVYPQWRVEPPTLLQLLPWPVFLGVFIFLWNRRLGWARHALLGLGFFFIMLLPFVTLDVGGFTTMTWVMDHFLYIPILGLIALTIAALDRLIQRLPLLPRRGLWAVVALVLLVLIGQSRSYASLYRDQQTLWTYTLERNPSAWVAHYNLGNTLMQRGQIGEGMAEYGATIMIHPQFARAYYNMAVVYAAQKRWDQAIHLYQAAISISPDYLAAHNNLAVTLVQAGRLPEALDAFATAVRLAPDDAKTHVNFALALDLAGHKSEALQQYQLTLALDPNNVIARYNLEQIQVPPVTK